MSEKQSESFLKYYPIDILDNEGMEVIQSFSGGYVIMANYLGQALNGTDRDLIIFLTDEFGRQINNSPVSFGTQGFDRGNTIIDVDDGYIIAGSSEFNEKKHGYLVKLNNNGQPVWQKNYQGYSDMEFREVIQHQDGGYIMTGYVKNISGEQKIILFRTNSVGDSLWTREIGYVGFNDSGESLERYQDRLFVIGTTTPLDQPGYSQLLVLNTNLDGKGIFALKIPGTYDLSGKEILLDPYGDLYILGNEKNPFSGEFRIYLARLELIGNELEQVALDEYKYLDELNSVYGADMEIAEFGELAIAGWESNQNDYNIYFTLINDFFQTKYRQTFGANGYQSAQSVYYTSDEGFALTGSVDLGGGRMCMLIKLNSNGELR